MGVRCVLFLDEQILNYWYMLCIWWWLIWYFELSKRICVERAALRRGNGKKNTSHRVSQRRKKKQQRKRKGATVAHSSSCANSSVSDGEADEGGGDEKKTRHTQKGGSCSAARSQRCRSIYRLVILLKVQQHWCSRHVCFYVTSTSGAHTFQFPFLCFKDEADWIEYFTNYKHERRERTWYKRMRRIQTGMN